MKIVEIAETAEACINDMFSFEIPKAHLYGVTVTDGQTSIKLLSTHADVYELLEQPKEEAFDYFGVVTTGWAAPLNADGEVDGKPSEHAQRRRVRLMVVASREDVVSVLRFADEPDEIITDEGNAVGSLADAIQQFVSA
jgi:hypothetical protein